LAKRKGSRDKNIIGGEDFNAKTGKERGWIEEEKRKGRKEDRGKGR